jgi:hypothetical protein
MQKYTRLYDYIHEYQQFVYDTYSKHGIAFLVTYYNIHPPTTIWEDENLLGGPYEKVGDLSGVSWNKYLLLPIYYIEEVTSHFDGQEIGYIKEGETNIVFPSTYGITPYANDKVKFEQAYLRPTNDIYPVFSVTGVEISANTDKRFWKLKLEVEQSVTTTQIDDQVNTTYTFFEYDKKIHTIEDAEVLTNLLIKNELLKDSLGNLFNNNSGTYLF